MKRWGILLFGIVSYLIFLGVFLYAIGFIGGFLVPTSLDGPASTSLARALAINLGLLTVFALQHSVMARPAFKAWWTKIVPVPMERSVYVLFSNVAMVLFFVFWQPMGGTVWNVTQPWAITALYTLFGIGWVTVLLSTILINHFDLFGLRQVWLQFRGKPYTHLEFATPGPYRLVRHPLYVGWLTVSWATPTMTMAHLVFAIGVTAYILIAIGLEERDLIQVHGEKYLSYQEQVPMLIPRSLGRKPSGEVGRPASATAEG